jgi:hypothetical protein
MSMYRTVKCQKLTRDQNRRVIYIIQREAARGHEDEQRGADGSQEAEEHIQNSEVSEVDTGNQK